MSLGGGDQLARGGHSATFPSCAHVQQILWDMGFITPRAFKKKYGKTKKQYQKELDGKK